MAAKRNPSVTKSEHLVMVEALPRALKQKIKEEYGDADLAPGEYVLHGTLTVKLDGTLTRADPTEAEQKWKPDWPAVVGHLCMALGVADPEIAATLLDRALEQSNALPTLAQTDALEAALKRRIDGFSAALPKVPRQGATKFAGDVELVSFKRAP